MTKRNRRLDLWFMGNRYAPSAGAPAGPADIYTYLESWWALDEFSDGSVGVQRDDSHGSNDLTDNNTTASAAGKVGNAADFEYDNDEYLSIADNDSMSPGTGDFAFACWVNLETDAGVQRRVLGKFGGTGDFEYYLTYVSGTVFYWIVSSDGTSQTQRTAASFGTPSTGTWYFIVAWHDDAANTINICVNDGTVDSAAHAGGADPGDAAFTIGVVEGDLTDHFWDGLIDEVAFWKGYIPSAAEITALFNAGSGMSYATFVSTYGP